VISERLLPELISAGVAEAFKNKGLTPTPPRTATVVSVDNRNATAIVTMDGEQFQSTSVRTLVPTMAGDRVVVDFTTGGGAWVRGVLNGRWSSFGNFAFESGLGLGNGTVTARFAWRGPDVHLQMHAVVGTTTSIAGQIVIHLPVQAAQYDEQQLFLSVYDTSTGTNYYGKAVIGAGGTSAGLYTAGPVTQVVPMAWAAGDNFTVSGTYESA